MRCRDPPARATVPEILYSGTTFSYVRNQWLKRRKYTGLRGSVWLTESYPNALAYSIQRAAQYSDKPIIMVVNVRYLPSLPQGGPTDYTTPLLPAGSFSFFDAVYPKSINDSRRYVIIRAITNATRHLQPSDLEDIIDKELAKLASVRSIDSPPP